MEGDVPPQVGNDHPTSMPTSAYKTKDGHINVAFGRGHVDELCKALGREDMLQAPEFKGGKKRAENRKQLNAAIEEALKKKIERRVDRDPEQGRHPVRADLQGGRGIRRSAG